MSRACPRRRPVRASPTTPKVSAEVVQRLVDAGAIVIGKTNLDQFATGLVGVRSPYGVPRNPFNRRLHSRRLELGLGGRRVERPGELLARHRHRGLGPRAGRLQQHRRAEADARSAQQRRHGAGLRVARLRLDLRSFLRRCGSHRPGRRQTDATGRRSPTASASACRDSSSSSATTSMPRSTARRSRSSRALGGTAVPFDYAPFRDAAQLLYGGPWVAERTAAVGGFIEKADAKAGVWPVTRDIILGGREVQRRRRLRRPVQARGFAQAAAAEAMRDVDFLALPTAGTIYTWPISNASRCSSIRISATTPTS